LTLVARREDRLQVVADRCRKLGSPDVAVVRGDVSVIKDCKRFVQETISRFGRCELVTIIRITNIATCLKNIKNITKFISVDHLVNNAGIAEAKFFEDYSEISDVLPIVVYIFRFNT